jgi:hypothetical protein
MGHQDGVNLVRLNFEPRQSPTDFSQRKAAVNEDKRIARPDQGRVALAAGAEGGELHWQVSPACD